MIPLYKLFEAGFTKNGRFMPNTASVAEINKRKSSTVVKDPDQSQTRHKIFYKPKFIPTRKNKLGSRRKVNMFSGNPRSNLPSYK